MPTKIRLTINCGCGKTFDNVPDANAHVESTNHILTVFGTIRPAPGVKA